MESIFGSNSMYGGYGNGMQYAQQKELTWTNALSAEEEKALHKGPEGLSLEIPKEDMFRAKCTHRDPKTKQFTIRENKDHTVTCLKCGATFNVVDNVDPDLIKKTIGGVIDILQTAKMAYIDMTPEAIQTYFIILPFLEIAPQLYEAAMQTLSKALPGAGITGNNVNANLFDSLYNTVGNPAMMNPAAVAAAYSTMMGMGGGMPVQEGPVPFMNNPMQTGYRGWSMGTPAVMPGVAETVPATGGVTVGTAAPKEGQTVVSNGKYDLG